MAKRSRWEDDENPLSPPDLVDMSMGAGDVRGSVRRGTDSLPPIQKSKGNSWDIEADLRRERESVRGRRPDIDDEKYKPGLKRKILAGAVGGVAGYVRGAGRSRVRDTKELTNTIMRPGYKKDTRRWESEMDDVNSKVADAQAVADAAMRERKAKADDLRAQAAKTAADAAEMNARSNEADSKKVDPPETYTLRPGDQRRVSGQGGEEGRDKILAENPKTPPVMSPREKAESVVLDKGAKPEDREWSLKMLDIMNGKQPKGPIDKSIDLAEAESGASKLRAAAHQKHAAALAAINKAAYTGDAGFAYGDENYNREVDNQKAALDSQLKSINESVAEQTRILSGGNNQKQWVNKYKDEE